MDWSILFIFFYSIDCGFTILLLTVRFKGTDPNFGQKLQFFFAGKASSGMWEICPKILGGYEY